MSPTKLAIPLLLIASLAGCGAGQQRQEEEFFTSGNREADQRAEQRMAKDQQLEGEGSVDAGKDNDKDGKTARIPENATLYQRLGGEQGIKAIVDDFVNRALEDPRVNWDRSGVKKGGFSFDRNESVAWDASDYNVGQLKKHIVQFLSLSTGGPTFYDGREMKQAHANLRITNPEFDAAVGDLKVTLDKLRVPDNEQKELLAIIETTRPQIVQER